MNMELEFDASMRARYLGKTIILCNEHDYKKFPGLEEDLRRYADNRFGRGWDDIKVNVEYAYGTKIEVSAPAVRAVGTPSDSTVVLAEDTVRNDSSEPIETQISLKGTFSNSISTTVENEFSAEVSSEIGGTIEIFTASVSAKVSTTARRGEIKTASRMMEYTRTVDLTVPPGKGFVVKMTATVEKRQMKVTLPCQIMGRFRVQYPRRVNGHYYWLSSISCAKTNDHDQEDMILTVEDGIAMNVKIIVEDLLDE